MSIPPGKLCPKCQSPAPLQAVVCNNCAHQFRTQFAPPIGQTQVMPQHAGPKPYSWQMGEKKPGKSSAFWLMSFIGGFAVFVFAICILTAIFHHDPGPPGPHAAAIAQQMQSDLLGPPLPFMAKYGSPDTSYPTKIGGVDYMIWDYHKDDGDIIVAYNKTLWVVERATAYGK